MIRLLDTSNAHAALGAMALLSAKSPRHRDYTAADMERLYAWPIAMGKALVFADEAGAPCAFVTHARFSRDVACAFVQREAPLSPEMWVSGETPWIIDMIAPFGHCREVTAFLRDAVFPGEIVYATRTRPGGRRAVATFFGKGARHAV